MIVFLCVQAMLCQTQLLLQHKIWPKTRFEIKIISINGVPNTPNFFMTVKFVGSYHNLATGK